MKKLGLFIQTTILGGVVVILPVTVLFLVFRWIFLRLTNAIQPFTDMITARAEIKEILADALVVLTILTVCFLVGIAVKTTLGGWFYRTFERRFLIKTPGYSLVKETLIQFISAKKSPFSSVALAQIFGNDTLVSAFVTDQHADGSYTVFVPTGPNPTSGNIYHLPGRYVYPIDVSVEDAMRSIISCGAGSSKLLHAYLAKKQPQQS